MVERLAVDKFREVIKLFQLKSRVDLGLRPYMKPDKSRVIETERSQVRILARGCLFLNPL